MLVVACGFSLNDLMNEPKNNLYVQVTKQLIEKMSFYHKCIEKLAEIGQNQQTEFFHKIFEG